jgi:hypothetical protein
MPEKTPVPEIGHPTVNYNLWSVVSRSSELVEITLPEIDELEDAELQDALWTQFGNAAFGDGSRAIVVYTSEEYGTHSYSVRVGPSKL